MVGTGGGTGLSHNLSTLIDTVAHTERPARQRANILHSRIAAPNERMVVVKHPCNLPAVVNTISVGLKRTDSAQISDAVQAFYSRADSPSNETTQNMTRTSR